jgi:prepilin-type N-terminal cleavage/methylation domain-containing protein
MSRTEPDRRVRGFTLLELLVSMVATSIMMAGLIQFFLIQGRTHAREEQRLGMDENLRVAAAMITDSLRNARYAAPTNVSTWITWVSGMNANPKLTQGGSSSIPDAISVAGCFKEPVASLSAPYVVGVTGTTLSVTPTGTLSNDLDTGSKSLIRIGEGTTAEFATVTGASGSTINISAALSNPHWGSTSSGGANICRVDVITYSVATDSTTGVPRLMRNDNQGAGAQPVAEGISNMKITVTGRQYTITLSGRSELRDPISGSWLTRNLQTTVSRRNS